jgi:hypothetical protein
MIDKIWFHTVRICVRMIRICVRMIRICVRMVRICVRMVRICVRMSGIKKSGKKTEKKLEISNKKKTRHPDLGNEPIALFTRVCAHARARIIV